MNRPQALKTLANSVLLGTVASCVPVSTGDFLGAGIDNDNDPVTHLQLHPDISVPGVTSYDIVLPSLVNGDISFEDHQDCRGSCSWDKSGCHFVLGMKRWPDPGIGMWYHCKDGKQGHAFDKEHTCLRCRGGVFSKHVDLAQYTPKTGWHYETIPTPMGLANWDKHQIIDWLKKYDFFPWQSKLHGQDAYGGKLTDLYRNPLVEALFTADSYGYINGAMLVVIGQEWPGGKHTFMIKLKQQNLGGGAVPGDAEKCTSDWLVFAGIVAGIALSAGASWTIAGAGALALLTVALVAAVQTLQVDGCINK